MSVTMDVKYYECHITVEPVLDEDRRGQLSRLVSGYGFRLAELLFQRNRESTPERSAKDSFLTARGDAFDELKNDADDCMESLRCAGFQVWRCKIEAALYDERFKTKDCLPG